jgi:hypothetical protein
MPQKPLIDSDGRRIKIRAIRRPLEYFSSTSQAIGIRRRSS